MLISNFRKMSLLVNDPLELKMLIEATGKINCKGNIQTLTLIIRQDGYEIGIADKDVKGFTPTDIILTIPDYCKAQKVLEKVNSLIYENQSTLESLKIVMSSMNK